MRFRCDSHIASQVLNSFLDSDDSQTIGLIRNIEPYTVVLNGEMHQIAFTVNHNSNVVRVGVTGAVRERLLDNTVDTCAYLFAKAVQQAIGLQVYSHTGAL